MFVIAQNFGCNIVEAQLAGTLQDASGAPTEAAAQLESLDYAFTAVFMVELAVNMASNLWDRFVTDSWFVALRTPSPQSNFEYVQ